MRRSPHGWRCRLRRAGGGPAAGPSGHRRSAADKRLRCLMCQLTLVNQAHPADTLQRDRPGHPDDSTYLIVRSPDRLQARTLPMSRSFLRLAPLVAALGLLLTPAIDTAAADATDPDTVANAATLPKGLAGELNAGAPPVIVSFGDLETAADAHRIRAAVVDPATRWVA